MECGEVLDEFRLVLWGDRQVFHVGRFVHEKRRYPAFGALYGGGGESTAVARGGAEVCPFEFYRKFFARPREYRCGKWRCGGENGGSFLVGMMAQKFLNANFSVLAFAFLRGGEGKKKSPARGGFFRAAKPMVNGGVCAGRTGGLPPTLRGPPFLRVRELCP